MERLIGKSFIKGLSVIILSFIFCFTSFSNTVFASNNYSTSSDELSIVSLSTDKNSIVIVQDQMKSIVINAVYSDGTTEEVTYDCEVVSSNEDVADAYFGDITGVSQGTANITYSYGSKSLTVKVVVKPYLEYLELSATEIAVEKGTSINLKAIATYENGSIEDVTAFSDWFCDDTDVVTVTKGKITGIDTGNADILFSFGGWEETIEANVISKIISLKADHSDVYIAEYDVASPVITAEFEDEEPVDVTEDCIYSSSNPSIAFADEGIIYGEKQGKTSIIYTYASKSVTLNVNVKPFLYELTADKDSLTVEAGKTSSVKLTAIYEDEKTENVTSYAYWESEDETIATVNKGQITGVSEGEAVIRGTYLGSTVDIIVKVEPKLISLEAKPTSITVQVGSSFRPEIYAAYVGIDEPVDVTEGCTTSSSKESIAYCENGEIYAVAEGTAVITYTYGSKSVNVNVTVKPEIEDIILDREFVILEKGSTSSLKLTAIYTNGKTEDVTKIAEWVSYDEETAAVTQGKIKGITEGETSIFASYMGLEIETPVAVLPKLLKLTVNNPSVLIQESDTYFPEILAYFEGYEEPANVTEFCSYSVSKGEYVTVENGEIYANKMGSAVVSYTFISKTIKVNVTVKPEVDHIYTDIESLNIEKGSSYAAKLMVVYSNGKTEDITKYAQWYSDNEEVAAVSQGKISAVDTGEVYINASCFNMDASVEVIVIPKLIKLETRSGSVLLQNGNSFTPEILATFEGEEEPVDVTEGCIVTSSNPSVAEVNGAEISAIKEGSSSITYTFGKKSVKINLIVKPEVDRVEASVEAAGLEIKGSISVKVTAYYINGKKEDITKYVVWNSDDSEIAKVSGGKITGVAEGETVVAGECLGQTIEIPVLVLPKLKSLSSDVDIKSGLTLAIDEAYTPIIMAKIADDEEYDVSEFCSIISGSTKYVVIEDGVIKAIAKGSSKITIKYGSKTISFKVTVE